VSDLYATELQRLAELGVPSSWVDPLGRFMDGTSRTKELAPVTRELGAMLAHACRGNEGEAHRHGQQALDVGATRPQVFEAMIVALLHGGFDKLLDHLWLLESAPEAAWPESEVPANVTDDDVTAHFSGGFGGALPDWVRLFREYQPDVLDQYFRVRVDLFRDGALARKDKELILVIINAAEHYDDGLAIHTTAARRFGASEAEVMEAILAAIPAGGTVAWFASAVLAAKSATA
jgi:AhpD family alkylhydroperoxidase